MKKEFYVYKLLDPRDRVVFYVGKGKGYRAQQHKAVALSSKAPKNQKNKRIREICASGEKPIIEIVARFANEAEAYEFERKLIGSHTGLLNVYAGYGYSYTKEEACRRQRFKDERQLQQDHVECKPIVFAISDIIEKFEAMGLRIESPDCPAFAEGVVAGVKALAASYRSVDNCHV